MEIVLAEAAGFCFGVQRALDTAHKTASETEGVPIYTLGPLIHNPQVVQELCDRGIRVQERPEDIDSGVVIVRSHGVPPKVIDALEQSELTVVDATCPFVRRAMRWAKQLKDEGYQVVIIGDESHPEVTSVYGASDETAWIVGTPRAIDELPSADRFGIVAQTTQSAANYRACVCRLLDKCEELKAFNTICTATEQRQSSAKELAARVDVMVVIGGFNSANTQRLVEVCQESGAIHVYHVETADQLQPAWFTDVEVVGVTAGASTPDWLIEGVTKRMVEFSEEKTNEQVTEEQVNEEKVTEEQEQVEDSQEVVEEPAAEEQVVEEGTVQEAEETAAEADSETEDEQMPEEYAEVETPKPNTVVTGKVVQVGSDSVLVDIGYKYEGHVPLNELGLKGDQTPSDLVSEGDDIDVWVLKLDETEDSVLLSKRRADARQSWEKLEQLYEEGGILEATVSQTVKGGLLADVGVRGFIPASHVSRNFVDDLEKYVGQTLKLKIIELDRQKNNVVLSHKNVLEEEYQQAKEEAFAKLEEKQVVDGIVRRLTDFGAFVDIGGGVEGLLHVSEMAHSRVKHPSDVLTEEDEVKVMVLGVDREKERISLGLKQTLPDPWDTITERYQVDDKVSGEVTRVVDFGAFVKLEDGVEGLVHISQLSHRHVAKAEEIVNPGDQVDVKVISLDPDARRIGLSIRELEPKPETAKPAAKPAKAKQSKPAVKEEPQAQTEELTTTLGDLYGDLFKDNK